MKLKVTVAPDDDAPFDRRCKVIDLETGRDITSSVVSILYRIDPHSAGRLTLEVLEPEIELEANGDLSGVTVGEGYFQAVRELKAK